MKTRNIVIISFLIFLAIAAIVLIYKERAVTTLKNKGEPTSTPIIPKEEFALPENYREVYVFFQSSGSPLLVPEKRRIFHTSSITDQAKQTIVELIRGPETPGHLPTIPGGTKIEELYLSPHGTAFIDLSSDFITGQVGGSEEELIAVYSIVNTLTINFPSIKQVKFLIEGKERDTIKGHISLKNPFIKNTELLSERERASDGGED
jgi:spore germination protein GerM